jgi:hypothetical protein
VSINNIHFVTILVFRYAFLILVIKYKKVITQLKVKNFKKCFIYFSVKYGSILIKLNSRGFFWESGLFFYSFFFSYYVAVFHM